MADIEFDCPKCQHRLVVDERGAGRKVYCPQCAGVVDIPIASPKPTQGGGSTDVGIKLNSSIPSLPVSPSNTQSTSALTVFAVICFVVGCGLVVNGCANDISESRQVNSSAIRQIVYTIQYCTGIILIALCLILEPLIRLARKP